MNNKLPLSATIVCSLSLLSVIGFTRPSVGAGWVVVLFFIFYFGLIFFGTQSIGLFIGLRLANITKVSFVLACIGTSAQVLITFQALRPIELILITTVLVITGWYVSKAKS